jgi:hypothetical protein
MQIRSRGLAAFVLCSACALPAFAQRIDLAQRIKPGLWEITQNPAASEGSKNPSMASVQKELAKLDPKTRKMMEQSIGKPGIQLGAGPDGGVLMCMTPELIANFELMAQDLGDCTRKLAPAAGSSIRFSFSCPDGRSGNGEVNFQGSTGVHMKTTASESGSQEPEIKEVSGKWLGADCAGVMRSLMAKAK